MKISSQQKYRLAITFAVLAMGLAGATNASGLTTRSITVRYADLRIETEQGATKLLRRIERAAVTLCEPLQYGTLATPFRAEVCRQQTTAAAVAKMSHPMLQAVYDRTNGVRPPMASLGR